MRLLRTLAAAKRELPRVLPLMRDTRVPLWAKILASLAAALIVSPIDIFGDIPILGLVDDVALLMVVIHFFVGFAERRTAPRQLVRV